MGWLTEDPKPSLSRPIKSRENMMNKKYNEKNAEATAVEICGTLRYQTELQDIITAAEKRLSEIAVPPCTDDGALTPDDTGE